MFDGVENVAGMPGAGVVAAAAWICDFMTGTIATLIATLAIAAFGFAMLQGRLSVKAGARVVLGCFILFGAPFIAKELMPERGRLTYSHTVDDAPFQPMPEAPTPASANRDPYAGASVPNK